MVTWCSRRGDIVSRKRMASDPEQLWNNLQKRYKLLATQKGRSKQATRSHGTGISRHGRLCSHEQQEPGAVGWSGILWMWQ